MKVAILILSVIFADIYAWTHLQGCPQLIVIFSGLLCLMTGFGYRSYRIKKLQDKHDQLNVPFD